MVRLRGILRRPIGIGLDVMSETPKPALRYAAMVESSKILVESSKILEGDSAISSPLDLWSITNPLSTNE